MTSSVTFETATIADSLKKAEACAPKMSASDQAFGTAAGIVLELHPAGRDGASEPAVHVRATNLEVFYDEWVDCVKMELGQEISAPGHAWRIPVAKFTGVIAALPIGTGRTVTFAEEGGLLKLSSGRTTAKVHMIPMDGYPVWEPYSEEHSSAAVALGQRISQVAWACDPKEELFSGIYFDGTSVVAANRQRAALVPCEVPVLADRAVTVPAKVLGPVIRHAGDVRVGVYQNFVTISPDEHTQIRCTIFDQNIPDPSAFTKIRYDASIVIDKELLVETIRRMLNVTKGTKDVPVVKMLIGGGQMSLRVEGTSAGEFIEDSIPLDGQGNHFPVVLQFVPSTFTEAVGKAPDEKVAIWYNAATGAKNTVVSVEGGGGYRAWFVQWRGLPDQG